MFYACSVIGCFGMHVRSESVTSLRHVADVSAQTIHCRFITLYTHEWHANLVICIRGSIE
jgi:hypothetical protein